MQKKHHSLSNTLPQPNARPASVLRMATIIQLERGERYKDEERQMKIMDKHTTDEMDIHHRTWAQNSYYTSRHIDILI